MDKFDDASKREIAVFIEEEKAKAQLQTSIHKFTGMCWKKCVTGSISTRFSRGEESCLMNCVDRFLDSSLFIVKTLEAQRGQPQ